MERIGAPRSFRNGIARQHAVRSRLEQLRPPNGEPQGEVIAEAFSQSLARYVHDPQNEIGPVRDYSLSMRIHHSTRTQTWTGSGGSEITEAWLDKLAKQLNSTESFDAANGEFYVELLFFKNRQRGSGRKKNNPGSMSYEQLLEKKCTINIKNRDKLCFARALVSTKAYVDQDPQYETISKGCGLQGVAEGACGSEQIQQIQDHVGPDGYQIKVFEGQQEKLWFKDDKFIDAPKKMSVEIGKPFSWFAKYSCSAKPQLLLSSLRERLQFGDKRRSQLPWPELFSVQENQQDLS